MRLLFSALACGMVAVAMASQTPEVKAVKVSKPPTIDGTIDPQEWTGIPSMSGGYDEQTGGLCPEETTYWFAYDEKFVYFAARCKDTQAATIKAQEFRTNVALRGDDYVGIFVDPFNQPSGPANQFEINPKGATNLRIAGGRAAKREWLGEILAKGRVTSEGYEVEARIPWAIMRIPGPGRRDMRIGAYRVMPRLGRAYLITDLTNNQVQNIPLWKDVECPIVPSDRMIKFLPYTYLGWEKDSGGVFNSGLDMKYTTPGGIDMIGSINPDFRNIENQVLSLDFSYFERLAGESRPFFLEGQNYFQTSQDAPLFAPQRIRSFDAGFKSFGKLGDKTTFAFLDAIDFNHQNDFVGTINHAFNDRTTLRVAVADRNAKNSTNPGPKRFDNLGSFVSVTTGKGPFDFFGQYERTKDTLEGNGGRVNTGFVYTGKGSFGLFEYTSISPQFLPRLGFAPERGFKGFSGHVGMTRQYDKGPLLDTFVIVSATDWKQWTGNGMYRKQYNAHSEIGLRNNLGIEMGAFYQEFQGFKDRLYSVQLNMPRNNPYRNYGIEYQWGEFAGQRYSSIGPSVSLRPYKNFQLAASLQRVRHFSTNTQAIVSGSYEINAYDSVVGRVIQNDSDVNAYVAYRRTGNTGNEYFLIVGDPNSTTGRFRPSIILKAVFPFSLKF